MTMATLMPLCLPTLGGQFWEPAHGCLKALTTPVFTPVKHRELMELMFLL